MTTLEPSRTVASVSAPSPSTGTSTPSPCRQRPVPALVLEIVKGIDDSLLQPVARPDAGIAFQPRILLAMITYCYAIRICGSQDIEAVMREDSAFRILCSNEFPDWNAIRRFRRHNREALQRCLTGVLHRLEFPLSPLADHAARSGTVTGPTHDVLPAREEPKHEDQAVALIELAILLDSMAND